jgi:hypothetical protein
MPDADVDVGRLRVLIPQLGAGVRPTVNLIDARSLELVTTTLANEEIEVPAGQYVVSSTLPSGERALTVTTVSSGAQEEVALPVTARIDAYAATPVVPPSTFEQLGSSPEAALDAGGPPEPLDFFLRYLGVRRDGIDLLGAECDIVGLVNGGADIELLVRPPAYEGVVFTQLAAPGVVPLNIALPANGMTSVQSCRLTVTTRPLSAVVSLADNPLVDAVARYIHSGNLQEAANVAPRAEQLLRRKLADPISAALGGYALLRLQEFMRLHDWPANLSDWFPWLPDGPIIAGEAAALAAEYPAAVGYFCEAARRGLPLFADGFSMLVSRLREYAQVDRPPGVAPDLLAEAARHAKRLLPLSALTDFARISFAVYGARLDDLPGSQEPIWTLARAEGWRRVSPVTATIGR